LPVLEKEIIFALPIRVHFDEKWQDYGVGKRSKNFFKKTFKTPC